MKHQYGLSKGLTTQRIQLRTMKHLLVLLVLLISTINISAEPEQPKRPNPGSMVGRVVDSNSGDAIEYANIAIYSAQDSSLVTGGITNAEGKFMIEGATPGNYYATFKFIGYQTTTKENIVVTQEPRPVRIGEIKLKVDAQSLSEVNVFADKQQVLFKIDKKVVNPSQFLAAQGGSAIDILANTPSVTVDIEGNVTMRGSSNFMVLINGKPTPFTASDALAQVPAASIDNIEIITNPSAKYDPDGAAGIINIITKKEAQTGWNGIANLSANTLGAYSGDVLFNFNSTKFSWYVGANRVDRLRAADYTSSNGTYNTITGDTFHILQDGERSMNFTSNALKTGFDYNINENNNIGIELQGGTNGRYFDSDLINKEWSTGQQEEISFAEAITDADGHFGSITLSQKSLINDDKAHTLESSLFYQKRTGEDDTYSEKVDEDDLLISNQKTWEESDQTEIRLKTDYTRPWEKGKMEAGYQLRLDDNWSNYDASFSNDSTGNDYYNETTFYRLINSGYATFSGEAGQLGYQAGIRGEHTIRELTSHDGTSLSEINRMDWYPSVHLSYNLSQSQSFMTSYTRRIDRPRGHWLDPYPGWRDPNNVRQGNPNLSPQYVNSYELSYQLRIDNNFLSAELFHRHVQDKMEQLRGKHPDLDGVLLTTYDNVGEDYSTGIEVMLNYNLTEWWALNISTSVFDYRLDVTPEFESSIEETQSTNWKARMSNTFKPTTTFRIQFDAMYNSPTITATGTRSAMAFTSLAVKKSFFNRKLDLSVSVMDVFNTAKMDRKSSGDDFYSNYTFDMKSPVFQFTLTYLFNNYKPERKRGQGGEGMNVEF